LELFDFARFFRGGVRRSGVLGTGFAGWVEWVDIRTKWGGVSGWETGFRGLGRGRGGCFGAGFFGFAGAEGVENARFADAAAEGGGIELAEGEFDLVPDVLDELVCGGAEVVDVGLLPLG
jgi:hypothetical protein